MLVKKEMLILDKEQKNEHNHGKFWHGYIISIIPLGAAIYLVSNLWLVDSLISGLFILGVIGMLTFATVLMFKGINEKRNECQICRKN